MMIAMHQAGFTQAVASRERHLRWSRQTSCTCYAENILLAYDSDGAGTKAALRGIGILREAGLTGKVINMRPYKDRMNLLKIWAKKLFRSASIRRRTVFISRSVS